MHRGVVDGLPGRVSFRVGIFVHVTIPDGGDRAPEFVVVLGVEHRHEPDPVAAIAATGADAIDVVANYTSFQALRARLA